MFNINFKIKVNENALSIFSLTEINWTSTEIMTWISNYIPQFYMAVITYPCHNLSKTLLVKEASGSYKPQFGFHLNH